MEIQLIEPPKKVSRFTRFLCWFLKHNKTIVRDSTDPDNIEYYFKCERCGATRLQPSNGFESATLHIFKLRDSWKKRKRK
jgi:hypothetical protein